MHQTAVQISPLSLGNILEKVPSRDCIDHLGDFNSYVGSDDETWRDLMAFLRGGVHLRRVLLLDVRLESGDWHLPPPSETGFPG